MQPERGLTLQSPQCQPQRLRQDRRVRRRLCHLLHRPRFALAVPSSSRIRSRTCVRSIRRSHGRRVCRASSSSKRLSDPTAGCRTRKVLRSIALLDAAALGGGQAVGGHADAPERRAGVRDHDGHCELHSARNAIVELRFQTADFRVLATVGYITRAEGRLAAFCTRDALGGIPAPTRCAACPC